MNQSEKEILENLLSLTAGIEKKNVPERRRILDQLAESGQVAKQDAGDNS